MFPRFIPFFALLACGPQLPDVGSAWSVDTNSATWEKPAGADVLAGLFSDIYPIFLGLHALDGGLGVVEGGL